MNKPTHYDLFIDGRKLPLVKRKCFIIRLPSIEGSFCFSHNTYSVGAVSGGVRDMSIIITGVIALGWPKLSDNDGNSNTGRLYNLKDIDYERR